MANIRNLIYQDVTVQQPVYDGTNLTKWIHDGVVVWENGYALSGYIGIRDGDTYYIYDPEDDDYTALVTQYQTSTLCNEFGIMRVRSSATTSLWGDYYEYKKNSTSKSIAYSEIPLYLQFGYYAGNNKIIFYQYYGYIETGSKVMNVYLGTFNSSDNSMVIKKIDSYDYSHTESAGSGESKTSTSIQWYSLGYTNDAGRINFYYWKDSTNVPKFGIKTTLSNYDSWIGYKTTTVQILNTDGSFVKESGLIAEFSVTTEGYYSRTGYIFSTTGWGGGYGWNSGEPRPVGDYILSQCFIQQVAGQKTISEIPGYIYSKDGKTWHIKRRPALSRDTEGNFIYQSLCAVIYTGTYYYEYVLFGTGTTSYLKIYKCDGNLDRIAEYTPTDIEMPIKVITTEAHSYTKAVLCMTGDAYGRYGSDVYVVTAPGFVEDCMRHHAKITNSNKFTYNSDALMSYKIFVDNPLLSDSDKNIALI